MSFEEIKIGDYVFVDKPSSRHDREEGKVLFNIQRLRLR